MTDPVLAGLDIGGTQCSVNLATLDGNVVRLLERDQFPTDPERGPDAILAEVETRLARLIESGDHGPVSAIGVSCGGPLVPPAVWSSRHRTCRDGTA